MEHYLEIERIALAKDWFWVLIKVIKLFDCEEYKVQIEHKSEIFTREYVLKAYCEEEYQLANIPSFVNDPFLFE